jgi:hypothetical protein
VLSVLLLRVLPGSQAMPAAVLVLLIAGAAAILPISGRTPDEWLPVVAGTFTARLRGEHRYRARRASQGFTSALDGEALKRPQAMPPVLRGCRLLSAHLADGSELGMLQDPELGAYTAVVVLHARAVSRLPPAEHERRLEQWVRSSLPWRAGAPQSVVSRSSSTPRPLTVTFDSQQPSVEGGARRCNSRNLRAKPSSRERPAHAAITPRGSPPDRAETPKCSCGRRGPPRLSGRPGT